MQLTNDLNAILNDAWDGEVELITVKNWLKNFTGEVYDCAEEQRLMELVFSKFIYFNQKLIKEMLKSVYAEYVESPIKQAIRRKYPLISNNHADILSYYQHTLQKETLFIGVGNPSESGAHLLYYFRQVNGLSKNNFSDIEGIYNIHRIGVNAFLKIKDLNKKRYIFFDDLIGSGQQASEELYRHLEVIRNEVNNVELIYITLFATSQGLRKLNSPKLFNGSAVTLFELDESYRLFSIDSRYKISKEDLVKIKNMCVHYANKNFEMNSDHHLGYRGAELLLGFNYNTPDNTIPIFSYMHPNSTWKAVFPRYPKF